MRSILLLIWILLCHQGLAQDFSLNWSKAFVGTETISNPKSDVDSVGNIYTIGSFRESDFDPSDEELSIISNGERDIFLSKLDSNGDLVWVKTFGGAMHDAGIDVKMTALNNILITGYFSDTVEFITDTDTIVKISQGNTDVFVMELDPDGVLNWVVTFGGANYERPNALTIDNHDNIYLIGTFFDTLDFDEGLAEDIRVSNGVADIFIRKMDANGNHEWVYALGGTGNESPRAIYYDSYSDDIYFTGAFRSWVDFDSDTSSWDLYAGSWPDGFLAQIDQEGSFVWAASFGGSETDAMHDVVTDEDGSIICTGYFMNTVDFDPSDDEIVNRSSVIGSRDGYVLKLDSLHEFEWVAITGDSQSDIPRSICLDDEGDIYIFGDFEGTVDFDPNGGTGGTQYIIESEGQNDFYLQKLDDEGAFVFAKSLGGSMKDFADNIVHDNFGNIYLTGIFEDEMDTDPSTNVELISGMSGADCIIIKLSDCAPNETIQTISSCYPFEWIDGFTYTESNNSAWIRLTNETGCDSVIRLDLTINPLPNPAINLSDSLICVQVDSLTLNGSPFGGVFYGENVSEDVFSPSMAGEGIHTIFYYFEDEFGCFATDSATIEVRDCLGTDKNRLSTVSIYPNPFDDFTTIDFGTVLTADDQIIIHNSLGQEVYRKKNLSGSKIILFNKEIEMGVYVLSLVTKNETVFTAKLIVQ